MKVVFKLSRALLGGSRFSFCKPTGSSGPNAWTRLEDRRRLELSKNYDSLKGNLLPVSGDIKAETKCQQGHERKFWFRVGNSQALFWKVCTHKTQRGFYQQTFFKTMSHVLFYFLQSESIPFGFILAVFPSHLWAKSLKEISPYKWMIFPLLWASAQPHPATAGLGCQESHPEPPWE